MSNLKNPTDSSGNSLKVRYRIWHSGFGFQLCTVNLLTVSIGEGENEMMKIMVHGNTAEIWKYSEDYVLNINFFVDIHLKWKIKNR